MQYNFDVIFATHAHLREMFDVAKRAMGEFRDDMTNYMWE